MYQAPSALSVGGRRGSLHSTVCSHMTRPSSSIAVSSVTVPVTNVVGISSSFITAVTAPAEPRSSTSVTMAIGVIIGLIYFLASRTLANSGQVFDIDPMLIAWAPSLALGLITMVGLIRLR